MSDLMQILPQGAEVHQTVVKARLYRNGVKTLENIKVVTAETFCIHSLHIAGFKLEMQQYNVVHYHTITGRKDW